MGGASSALILISFLIFDRENTMTLAASLIGTTSLIFNAKGNPIGQALMILFSLLYGLISGWEPAKCLSFGWASGVLAASSLNDYAEPADEKQVWDIYAGNARVQR